MRILFQFTLQLLLRKLSIFNRFMIQHKLSIPSNFINLKIVILFSTKNFSVKYQTPNIFKVKILNSNFFHCFPLQRLLVGFTRSNMSPDRRYILPRILFVIGLFYQRHISVFVYDFRNDCFMKISLLMRELLTYRFSNNFAEFINNVNEFHDAEYTRLVVAQ